MKKLLTGLLLFTTYYASAQVSPAVTPPSGTKIANTNQAYIWQNGGGDTTRLFLRLGASGISAAYYELKNGTGGGGITIDTNRLMYLDKNQTSTAYKAFTGRLAASNSGNLTGAAIEATSTNSGLYGLEVNNTGGGAAFKTTTTGGISSENINVSASIPSAKIYNLSTGPHAQFGSTTGKIATVVNSGNIITPKASASNHVVIKSQLDSVGALITGGVTSVAAGYGMDFTTITTSGSVAVDTSVIASREYVDLRSNRIIKDFYSDSTLAGTTSEELIYADTIPANTLFKNGDKITFMVAGLFETITSSSNNTFTIKLGGIPIFSSDATAITAGFRSFNLETTLMKASTDLVKVTSKFTFELQSDESVINNVIVNQFYQGTFTLTGANELAFYGQLGSSTTNVIAAKMGYIEFKPAAL